MDPCAVWNLELFIRHLVSGVAPFGTAPDWGEESGECK
jgi:hypothetical protein